MSSDTPSFFSTSSESDDEYATDGSNCSDEEERANLAEYIMHESISHLIGLHGVCDCLATVRPWKLMSNESMMDDFTSCAFNLQDASERTFELGITATMGPGPLAIETLKMCKNVHRLSNDHIVILEFIDAVYEKSMHELIGMNVFNVMRPDLIQQYCITTFQLMSQENNPRQETLECLNMIVNKLAETI